MQESQEHASIQYSTNITQDAIIVDSAISTGIEKYAMRRGVKLIGVAPEQEVKYPNQTSGFVDPYEISNGHTHIFLLSTF